MHTQSLEFVEATLADLEEINTIYLKCRENLFANGILQWDDNYPNKEYFQECIEDQCLFVLKRDTEIIGHVVLNEWESDEWERISWEGTNPLIIHSLMINPLVQGKGLGTDFVMQCERFTLAKGYKSIRLDAFSGNERAIHLYQKLGYKEKGSVYFTSKPEGHQEYRCFEKLL